jgi:heat shock protein HslJ
MQTRIYLAVFTLLFSLALAGCSSSRQETISLDGTSWQLAELSGQAPINNSKATIQFEGDTVKGRDSCNYFSGTYSVDGDKLTLHDLATTLMYCGDEANNSGENKVMAQAQAFGQALGQTSYYKVQGDQLRLLDAKHTTLLTFTRQDSP